MVSKNEIKYFASLKQKKYREKEKKFLLEGFHLVEECLNSRFVLEIVFVRDDIDIKKYQNIYSALKRKNVRLETLPGRLFSKLVETKNSQGIVGVVVLNLQLSQQNYLSSDIIIALDRISDPGNLGAILRTAYWFDVKTVLLSSGSVDIFNSKVLRSSQGAIFHIHILSDVDLAEELPRLSSAGFQILLFEPDADSSLSDISQSGKFVLVFGNEAGGISRLLFDLKYKKIKIDSFSDCESLNVAVACGVALHQIRLLEGRKASKVSGTLEA